MSASNSCARIVPSEIKQDGKTLIPINEKDRKAVFVSPCVYRERLYINIREFFIEDPDVSDSSDTEIEEAAAATKKPYFKPTQRGVALTEPEFENLVGSIERVRSLIQRLKRKQAKNESKRKLTRHTNGQRGNTTLRRASFL